MAFMLVGKPALVKGMAGCGFSIIQRVKGRSGTWEGQQVGCNPLHREGVVFGRHVQFCPVHLLLDHAANIEASQRFRLNVPSLVIERHSGVLILQVFHNPRVPV